jgi:hypothetical protein
MGGKPLLLIENEEALILADWLSIQNDLSSVIMASKRLCTLLDKEEKDLIIIQSLWTSALIRYARCFTSGKRKPRLIPEIYKDLEGDPIGTHQYYIDTRNKHIAHPVNVFEEVKIGILPSDTFPEKPAYIGIGHLLAFRVADAKEGVAQLGMLATVAYNYAKNEAGRAKESLERKIDSLSKEELRKLRPLRIQPQGGGNAAKTSRK